MFITRRTVDNTDWTYELRPAFDLLGDRFDPATPANILKLWTANLLTDVWCYLQDIGKARQGFTGHYDGATGHGNAEIHSTDFRGFAPDLSRVTFKGCRFDGVTFDRLDDVVFIDCVFVGCDVSYGDQAERVGGHRNTFVQCDLDWPMGAFADSMTF